MIFSSNTLDLAISGDGFFPLKSQDGFQDIFTRNGVFMMNDQYNVVNSAGQRLMAASVDSSGKANLDDMNVLTIPQKTTGMAKQTSKVQLGLNFPADAEVITKDFNRNDPESYNKSTALTVYDAGGNSYLASVYYVKTSNASQQSPNNKWQTYVYVGDKLVNASLQQATNSTGELMYVNKYGELKAKSDFKTPEEIAELNSSFSKKTVKFSLDDLTDVRTSQPAAVTGGQATDLGTGSNDGIDIGSYINVNKSDLLWQQGSSAVNYALPTSAITSTDEVLITVGPSTAQVKVPVTSSTAGSPPNAVDVAAALNNNSTFASSYVAQAYSSVTLQTVTFPEADASVNDFDTFEVTINGQTISLTNLSPAKANLDSLAAEIQHRLREEDGDRTDLVVKVSNNSLVLTDNASRKLTSVKLTPNPANAATVDPELPDPTDYSTEQLKITALDPSVTAAEVAQNIVIKQGTFSTASPVGDVTRIDSVELETEFPRFSETYVVNDGGPYKVQLGTGTTAITLQQDAADSLTAFMQKLNSNERFAASFDATLDADGNIKITAKDPTTSDTKAITGELSIMDATGEALVHAATVVEDGTAPPKGAPVSFAGKKSIDDLKNLFTVNVDGSIESVAVSLDHLVESMSKLPATASKKLSGAQIAAELTNVMARAYGDEKPFNFSTVGSPTFYVSMTKSDGSSYDKVPINLAAFGDMRNEDLVRAVQRQLDDEADYSGKVTVSYDTQLQKLVFAPANNAKVTISSDQSAIGLSDDLIQGVNDESVGLALSPAQSTGAYRPSNDQRYGMKVEYDAVKQSFVFKSGTTGDGSAIGITKIRPGFGYSNL